MAPARVKFKHLGFPFKKKAFSPMSLLSFHQLSFGYGGNSLIEDVDLHIHAGERICLVGRNGTGKTTLFRLIEGKLLADKGQILHNQNLRVCSLCQEVPDLKGTVYEEVIQGDAKIGPLLLQYHQLLLALEKDYDAKTADKLDLLQHKLTDLDAWQVGLKADEWISRMNLDPDLDSSKLSAGLKRRILLARSLMQEPDLLLLDEPTNHMDLPGIEWLEELLPRLKIAVIFISHDRMLTRRLATRIIELDRGKLQDYPCGYDAFLERRKALLDTEMEHQAQFDKHLAEEEVWIRKGIKARRTRNEGRVRTLEQLRKDRSERKDKPRQIQLELSVGEKTGRKVIEAKNIGYHWQNQWLFRDFSSLILRGDKVAVLGANGCGKTTLLKVLLGELQAVEGTVTLGSNFQSAVFDQLHQRLDLDLNVRQNILPEGDFLQIGSVSKHVLSYLQDFLFTPSRALSPVRQLSGGEKNRLQLAKIFTQPSNVLVLDEPTNDLDAETVDLLIENLVDYQGTIITVSHDRDFINRVATQCFVFESDGVLREYVGGYDDWQRQCPVTSRAKSIPVVKVKSSASSLSASERKELNTLPQKIESLEKKQSALHEKMAQSDFYEGTPESIERVHQELKQIKEDCDKFFVRWEDLEKRQNS